MVRIPTGLLGFEKIKEYSLISAPEEAPFQWLQMYKDPSLAFLVINPFLVMPEYSPDVPGDDVRFLGLQGPEDVLLFNIVTIRGPQRATVNLKGPVVVNRRTWVGKQVILTNAMEYNLEHPLPAEQ